VSETGKPVALLARSGPARDRLRQALDAVSARVVLEEDPTALDAATLAGAAPQAVLIALEPAVEDALIALEPALEAPGLLVIFDEAELAAQREGWEAQRWIRHLAAKLHGHDNVLPPGHEQDVQLEPGRPPTPQQEHADDPFEPHLAEAAALAGELPEDRPGEPATAVPTPVPPAPVVAAAGWALLDETPPPVETPRRAGPPPLPDFSHLELVALEDPEQSAAAARAQTAPGAVLVIAGIGGPDAVRRFLVALPADFQRPVLIQLRLDGGRYDNLVKQMARVSSLPVVMAMPGDVVAAGVVHVLPDGVGVAAGDDGLRFIDTAAGDEPILALPPAESAVLLLSGADARRVEAALTLATRGAHVAGQALEGCYDAEAVRQLAAGGMDLGTPTQLAEQVSARWS